MQELGRVGFAAWRPDPSIYGNPVYN